MKLKMGIVLILVAGMLSGCSVNDFYYSSDDSSNTRSYEKGKDYDCPDFATREEVQKFFEDNGGPSNDFHTLDIDGDGEACESFVYAKALPLSH